MPRKAAKSDSALSFIFTPQGFVCDAIEGELADESLAWRERFEADRMTALYDLGFAQGEEWFSPSMRFLQRVSDSFVRSLIGQPDIELLRENATPALDEELASSLLLACPPAPGSEHVDADWVRLIFDRLTGVYQASMTAWEGSVEHYVAERSQDLRVAGRIFFHLVENRREADAGFPFAFMATYAGRTEAGAVEHFPLRYALTEYESDAHKLLELVAGLSTAAADSAFLGEFLETGELFHPLRLTQDEAYLFLRDVPLFEQAGISCRVPNWWKRGSMRPKVNVRIGDAGPAALGADALIQLSPSFDLDGVELSRAEIDELMARTEGLAFIKGKWVEVDHARLQRLIDAFDEADGQALSIFEALSESADEPADGRVVEFTRGRWLDGMLHRMRAPAQIEGYAAPATLRAELRPYQQVGFAWLSYLQELGFGACLADDMGLGKTVQLLAFLERLRVERTPGERLRALLVVPASLIGNWRSELEKFAPELPYLLLYGESARALNSRWADVSDSELEEALPELCITTYAMAQKIEMVSRVSWDVLVLDEAQAIKNPGTKQAKALKALPCAMRVALTGTPVENDLSNLWSLFDFLNPGMLGPLSQFKAKVNEMADSPAGYAPLRRVTGPFLLRRLKTDKSIIADLPDKVEIDQHVELTRKQVVLYRQVVAELEGTLAAGALSNVKRRGIVLSAIMKLKQVCNHPDQFLGLSAFEAKDSGKFQMLEELCRTIYEKRERVLVFTQFREMCDPLDRLLARVFERPGCVIHGQVPARRRTELVERFQGEEYVPYLVLSLKAGGTGLNLTAANNVIHFDRWWNPAVENQATDRAFRIGQMRDVMVHKMVCSHTLEERIAEIIAGKSKLVSEVVGEGETWLSKLDDAQIAELVRFGAER